MIELAQIFLHIVLISLTSYSGSAQSLFYEVGVTQLHWITNQDYISYLGFGFASPGPQVFSLATFIGYGKAGIVGGLVGTLGIYFMPVTLAIISGKYLQRWIKKPATHYFVTSIGVVSAGLLGAIGIKILTANHLSALYVLIALMAAIAINKKINPLIIIAAGLIVGLFI